MIQTSSFYEKRLQEHAFLHRDVGNGHSQASNRLVDEVMRDIQFSELRKKKLEEIALNDSSDNSSSLKEQEQKDIDNKNLSKNIQCSTSSSSNRKTRHTSRYTVRGTEAPITDIKIPEKDATREEENEKSLEESEPNIVNSKISCAMKYNSPSELQAMLQAQLYGRQAEAVSGTGTAASSSRNGILADSNGGDPFEYIPSPPAPPTSSYEDSIEDDQIKQLLDIKRWRANLMKRVVVPPS
jgi:hypothetical protein